MPINAVRIRTARLGFVRITVTNLLVCRIKEMNGTVADRPIGLDLIEERWLAITVEATFGCNSCLPLFPFLNQKK